MSKFNKRVIVIILIFVLSFISIASNYQRAQAGAFTASLVFKSAAGLLGGMTVGGLIVATVAAVGLAYGVYYTVENWDSITETVGNALDNASGKAKDWWDGVTESAVRNDDPVYTLSDAKKSGEIVDYFSYNKPKPPEDEKGKHNFAVDLAVVTAVKEILDKEEIRKEERGVIKYDYLEFLSKQPSGSVEQAFSSTSMNAMKISELSNKYLYHFHDEGNVYFYSPNLDGGIPVESTMILFRFNSSARTFEVVNRLYYLNNGKYVYFFKNMMNFTSTAPIYEPTFDNYSQIDIITSVPLSSSEFSDAERGFYSKELKVKIFDSFKSKLQFINHDVLVHDVNGILSPNVKTLGGDLTKIDSNEITSSDYISPSHSQGGITFYENDFLLDSLNDFSLQSNSTKQVVDKMQEANSKAHSSGERAFEVNTESSVEPNPNPDTNLNLWGKLLEWLEKIWQGIISIPSVLNNIYNEIIKLPNTISNIPGNIINGIENLFNWLFVPNSVSLAEIQLKLKNTIYSRTGLLTYPLSMVMKFLNNLKDVEINDCILTIPEIKFKGHTLLNKYDFNFSEYIRRSEFKELYKYYRMITNSILVIFVVNLAAKKGKQILGGG